MKSMIFILVYFVTFSHAQNKASSASADTDLTWNAKMKNLADLFSELLPSIVSEKRFNDPAQSQNILKKAQGFGDAVADLNIENKKKFLKTAPDSDPTLLWIADSLKRETQVALDELKKGNREYARNQFRVVAQHCISCHTRGSFGPAFLYFDKDTNLKDFSAYEKANLFAATRRFEPAIAEYMKIIKDKNQAQKHSRDWEKALREALLISVRVLQDSKLSLDLVKAALSNKVAPSYVQSDLRVWQQSIEEWQKEPLQSVQNKSYLDQVRELQKKALSTQNYPTDRSAEIYYLRISALAHDFLRDTKSAKDVSEALLIIGSAYEALRDLSLWDLHNLYYEECIRRSPLTEISAKCYERYEESQYFSYSGSLGVSIPVDVQQKLKNLKKQAIKK